MVGLQSKAIRTVLRWQMIATVALAGIAGVVSGKHGALSAFLGGGVSFAAGLAFALVASRSRTGDAGSVVVGALRAEGIKIILIVALLWLVMKTYENVVTIAFFGTFIVATVIFSAAAMVRED